MSFLFWDVDTQFDFMYPEGKLYVPGADTIIPNLQCLTSFAAQHQIPIVASTDAHLSTDPEFNEYPPHCLNGTPGQRKVEGTLLPQYFTIPNRKIDLPRDLGRYPQIILEKQTVDVFTNPNTEALLTLMGRRDIVLYGVVTEICVDHAARGLIRRGFRVHLVEDAVRSLDSERGQATSQCVRQHGGRLLTTKEVSDLCCGTPPDSHLRTSG
ncbi:MAG TPA: isochorismatase family cysteine hydrolase [Terriglobales bacterium]|nr:isochorismatase family cysteine hydrolase [Terriglobales bacterium]